MELIEGIRKKFPSLPLMADANSSYSLNDIDRLKELDQFGLMMIEQPLAADDIIDHAKLQQKLTTRICLDES
ncbi:o-succinylbenzoate synthase, partial [Shouchella clausii]